MEIVTGHEPIFLRVTQRANYPITLYNLIYVFPPLVWNIPLNNFILLRSSNITHISLLYSGLIVKDTNDENRDLGTLRVA